MSTPNMLLPVPTVSSTIGPDFATANNACFQAIDSHNHSTGQGVQISQDGISLAAAATTFDSLNFNTSNAYGLRSVRFTAQSAALALSTDKGCVYEAGVDLYYNDGNGNQVRLTQGGSIVGTAGSITGLPSGTASASYSGGTFVFQSATNTAANIDGGSHVFRNNTASSKGLTLNPPNAMASNYSLTLPSIPGSTSIMICDTSGNITASYTVDNSTITIVSNVIGVPAGGIGTTQLAAQAVTAAKIANSTITGTQVSSSINLPGNTVQENGLNVVVSNTNESTSLCIVKGIVESDGSSSGTGYTSVKNSTGTYAVTFTTPFGGAPTVLTSQISKPNPQAPHWAIANVIVYRSGTGSQLNANGFVAVSYDPANAAAAVDTAFSFIAMGIRA